MAGVPKLGGWRQPVGSSTRVVRARVGAATPGSRHTSWRFAMTIRILIWTLFGTLVVYGFLLVMSVT